MKNKKGFTLTELIIAVAISSIVLIVVFTFVVDTITSLSFARNNSEKVSSFHDFVVDIRNFKNSYSDISLIHDGISTGGYDVIMMKDIVGSGGILLGLVDIETNKLVKDITYENYKNRVIGYRNLTEQNISEILLDSDIIYEYEFFDDKIYRGLFTKDFQLESYNTGTIFDISIGMVLDDYNVNYEGEKWSNIPLQDIYSKIINL